MKFVDWRNTDPAEAVKALKDLYDRNTAFLRDSFVKLAEGGQDNARFRAFYPELGVSTTSYAHVDTRVSYGHVPSPGHYATTITRPDLFESYLLDQLGLIIRNHGVPVTVSESATPIPLHFAFLEGTYVEASVADAIKRLAKPLQKSRELGSRGNQGLSPADALNTDLFDGRLHPCETEKQIRRETNGSFNAERPSRTDTGCGLTDFPSHLFADRIFQLLAHIAYRLSGHASVNILS